MSKVCEACQLGKQVRHPFQVQTTHVSFKPLEMMYSNVWIESIRGCTYYVGFIDDHIKKVWVYFMKHKGEVFQHFLFSLIFCIAFCMRLRLPHFSIISILQCVHTHPIDFMGIHLLSCVHGNECIGGHHAIPNTFVAIT
jgi:hypothetical protein